MGKAFATLMNTYHQFFQQRKAKKMNFKREENQEKGGKEVKDGEKATKKRSSEVVDG